VNEGDGPLPNVSSRNGGLSVDIQDDDIKYEDVLSKYHINKRSISNNSTSNITSHLNNNYDSEDKTSFEFLFKQLRNNTGIENTFPLQRETLDFKFDFYEKLNKLNGINLMQETLNVNSEQFYAIKDFLKRKPFVVCDCDKNIGVAIMSHEIYNQLCYSHLKDTKNFVEIEDNPLPLIEETIAEKLLDLHNNKNISKKLYDKLF
jgi:hypothetical protein